MDATNKGFKKIHQNYFAEDLQLFQELESNHSSAEETHLRQKPSVLAHIQMLESIHGLKNIEIKIDSQVVGWRNWKKMSLDIEDNFSSMEAMVLGPLDCKILRG